MLTRILVRPRHALADCDPGVSYVVVSITDPKPFGEPARIPGREHSEGILRLEFFDFDQLPLDEEGPEYPRIRDGRMQRVHAEAIWGFLSEHPHVMALVISCEAGMSRSPSAAKAIADCVRISRFCIDGCYDPTTEPANRHVYDTVRGALVSLRHR